jgi:hypothetical protein
MTAWDAFWHRVRVIGASDDECWVWAGAVGRGGYGNTFQGGRYVNAHRVAYGLSKGPIPRGLSVLHSCDRKLCCNPAHLSVGTHADNMRDKTSRGRQGNQYKRGIK